MKKLLVTLSIFALSLNLFAQGLYIKAGGAYNFPLATQGIKISESIFDSEGFYNLTTNSNGIQTIEAVSVSLANGFNFGGAAGYLFSKTIGLEVGVSYTKGNTFKTERIYRNRTSTTEISGNMLHITPALIITGDFEKFNPFVRIGAIIGFGSVTYNEKQISNNNERKLELIFDNGFAMGGNAAAGISYRLTESLSISGEINFASLSFAPTEGEIVSITDNGEEVESEYPKIKLVEKYSMINYNDNPETVEMLQEKYPFSSLGLGLNVIYRF